MYLFIRICGFSGLLIVLSTIVILVGGILIICLSRTKKAVAVFALVSLIPVILGLLATASTFSKVNRVMKETNYSPEPGTPQYENYQQNCAEAKYPIYLGAGSSALLLSIAATGAILKKKKAGALSASAIRPGIERTYEKTKGK